MKLKPSHTTKLKYNPKLLMLPEQYLKLLRKRNTSFHTLKPKEVRSYRVVLRNMHFSINPSDIQSEIERLGHTVTNIYNIKHRVTKTSLSMFFVDLKPAPNNKDIFQIEYLQQCKIKFETTNHKRHSPMHQLPTLWPQEKCLPSKTQMCQMYRSPPDYPLPTQGKIEQSTLCPL
jgi:hypothetical protein